MLLNSEMKDNLIAIVDRSLLSYETDQMACEEFASSISGLLAQNRDMVERLFNERAVEWETRILCRKRAIGAMLCPDKYQELKEHSIDSALNSEPRKKVATSDSGESSKEAEAIHSPSDEYFEMNNIMPTEGFPGALMKEGSLSKSEEISFDEISEPSLSDDEEPAIEVEHLLESALLGHKSSYEELKKQADEQADPDFLYAMGVLLEEGVPSLGIVPRVPEAIDYYKKAATKGSLEAKDRLKKEGPFMFKKSGKYEEATAEDEEDYYREVTVKGLKQSVEESFQEALELADRLIKWQVILKRVARARSLSCQKNCQ